MTRIVLGVFATFATAIAWARVPRSEAFPIERLEPALHAEASRLLLRAADREALFTLIGGVKPISSGIESLRFPGARPDSSGLERLRRVARVFQVGDVLTATVQPFTRLFEGVRSVELVVVHRSSFAATVARHADLFGYLGLSPSSEPAQALVMLDGDTSTRRFRAYGHLFGYPDHAVRFFADAADSERESGQFVTRDFFQIPTFESPTGRFVYAVPKGHAPNDADLGLRRRSEVILRYYRHLRPQYIGPGKPGIVELLRDWMDDGTGHLSPSIAERKAHSHALDNP